MSNRLAAATSPYLLQHQDNPVHWQPWDATTLAEARRLDRPLLLSIGYAACHWCHVMAHESFENEAIAALMNQDFVNIKVDREERPDLDHIYQQALATMGQHGGWPLTMFLTPAGEPFWGGTYFPPESRYGRPGFPEVLQTVSRIWREDRAKVTTNTSAIKDALERMAEPAAATPLPASVAADTARRLVQAFDTVHGGFAGAPKFPQAPVLQMIWRQALLTGNPTLDHAVRHTLTNICQGGIYDHLGGGFARYTVDAIWLVPHFEKMLYDNAQLLTLLADVYALDRNPLYAARAAETVGWLEREMLVGDAFASSIDADSEGEEGKYYVWDAAEIDQLLGDAAADYRLAFGVTDAGNWEGKTILNRLHAPQLSSAEHEARLRQQSDILLTARQHRIPPGLDDKVLADWNGLTIEALVRASIVFERPDWLTRAQAAFQFVCAKLGDGSRLTHSWRADRRLEIAFLDDYANMAAAALALHHATGKPSYLDHATTWIDHLVLDFQDPAGGFFQVGRNADDLLIRPKTAQDGPTPAGNGTVVTVLARLHLLTGAPRYRELADHVLQTFSGDAVRNPAVHTSLLDGLTHLAQPFQAVIIGHPDNSVLHQFRATLLGAPLPPTTTTTSAQGTSLPDRHPAAGKGQIDGVTTVYVCPGHSCLPPIVSLDDLRATIAPDRLRPALAPV